VIPPKTGVRLENLKKMLQDFSYVIYANLIILISSSVLVLLSALFPSLVVVLSDSRRTPWGLVTSIFVHGDFYRHFVPNMVMFMMVSLLFILTNSSMAEDIRKKRSMVFLSVTFVSAIAVNILWIVWSEGSAIGASGAGFAAAGVTFGFTLQNSLPHGGKTVAEIRQQYRGKSGALKIYNLITFLPLFLLIVYFPDSFLGVGAGVNVFAHGFSFIIAFVGSYFYAPLRIFLQYPRRLMRL